MKEYRLFVLWTICVLTTDLVRGKSLQKLSDFECTTIAHLDLKPEHSLSKPYYQLEGGGWDIPHWEYGGKAVMNKDYIRLNPDIPAESGFLWNTEPVHMKNWEVKLDVKIHLGKHTAHGTQEWDNGLGFWYTRERMGQGPLFGSKDDFSGFGMMMEEDGGENGIGRRIPHNDVHLHIYPLVNNGTREYSEEGKEEYRSKGCTVNMTNHKEDIGIKIRYSQNKITVWTKGMGKKSPEWAECFTLPETRLSTGYYLGVSASSSQLASQRNYHDVIAIQTYQLDVSSGVETQLPSGDDPLSRHPKSESGSAETVYVVHPHITAYPSPGFSASTWIVPMIILMVLVAFCVASAQMYPNASEISQLPRRFH